MDVVVDLDLSFFACQLWIGQIQEAALLAILPDTSGLPFAGEQLIDQYIAHQTEIHRYRYVDFPSPNIDRQQQACRQ